MAPFRSFPLRRPFLVLLLLTGLLLPGGGRAATQPPVRLLARADALPLALDPAFEFHKVKTYFLESQLVTGFKGGGGGGTDGQESILFERRHLLYGAITASDNRDRYGDYYTFFWRAKRPANLTVRLEYRQQKTGGFVQAREVDYPAARGSHSTRFTVNGDDYLEQGRISAWRVLLIEDHRTVVALNQSALWR